MKTIRYSMIQDYLTCPKAFYDRHVLNKIETKQSSALHFGTALHLGIKAMLEQEDGIKYFNLYWDSIKDAPMQYYGDSWKGLKELANDVFLPNFKSRHLKKFSKYEQELELTSEFSTPALQGFSLKGTMDFVGLYEGKLTVADWKTSSKPYKKNKIHHNLQLYIYAYLYYRKTDKLPEQIMYKVFNKKDQAINTIVKPLTFIELQAKVKMVENAVLAMNHIVSTSSVFHGADCYCEGFNE